MGVTGGNCHLRNVGQPFCGVLVVVVLGVFFFLIKKKQPTYTIPTHLPKPCFALWAISYSSLNTENSYYFTVLYHEVEKRGRWKFMYPQKLLMPGKAKVHTKHLSASPGVHKLVAKENYLILSSFRISC